MIHQYPVLIVETHLDTFGHVNNATYLQIFEAARWDLITNRGFGLKEIQQRGLGPVILEITLKFNRELVNREEIVIETELLSYEGKVGKLKQTMKRKVAKRRVKPFLRSRCGIQKRENWWHRHQSGATQSDWTN